MAFAIMNIVLAPMKDFPKDSGPRDYYVLRDIDDELDVVLAYMDCHGRWRAYDDCENMPGIPLAWANVPTQEELKSFLAKVES